MDFKQYEVEGLFFKTDHCSTQKGFNTFGDEGKASAIKEMRNLAVNNDFLGEFSCESLTK